MRILITNDDGYQAKGIKALVEIMKEFGEVTVIAPKHHQSGMSMAVSLGFKQIAHKDLGDGWHYVDATPASCVKFGLNTMFLDNFPDVVVSGINHGINASVNVIYSGTMGACLVAAEKGIPAIGWSINSHKLDVDLHWLQPMIVEVTKHLLEEGFAPQMCYNVNAPVGEIEGIRWTRQCAGHWQNELVPIEGELPQGVESGWKLAGEFINDEPDEQDTDIWAVEHQLLAITPTMIDLTEYGAL